MNDRKLSLVLPRTPIAKIAVGTLVAVPLTVVGVLGLGVLAAEAALSKVKRPAARSDAEGTPRRLEPTPAAD